jgi:plasmid stability protein
MSTITVRNVPKDTHDELVSRASASGKSLQEYLRAELVAIAAKPDIETLLARVEKRLKENPTTVSSETILRHRDAAREE